MNGDRLDTDTEDSPRLFARAGTVFMLVLQAALAIEAVLLAVDEHYFSAFLTAAVLLLPLLFWNSRLRLPVELEITAVLFAFATLFLGEIRDFYERFWWWDMSIHFSSGLLLGLFGFMLVYIMNANRAVDLHMRPSFVAAFACVFAIAIGAVWEIVEFAIDQAFGTTMQKPRWGDPSGLTDTMIDLVLDSAGAVIVSFLGWRHIKSRREGWLKRLVRRNPQLFGAD